jgi:hypothetical protein
LIGGWLFSGLKYDRWGEGQGEGTAQDALPHLEKNLDPANAMPAAARELAST